MARKIITTEFIEFITEVDKNISADSIKKDKKHRKHRIKFSADSGIVDENTLSVLLNKINVPYTKAIASGSPLYKDRGYEIVWNNVNILILLWSASNDKVFPRKSFTPEQLCLSGKTFLDLTALLDAVNYGIDTLRHTVETQNMLRALVDAVVNDAPIVGYHMPLQSPAEVNKLTSDFGEILAAIYSSKQGNIIKFPNKSNNGIADYYENNLIVSAKGRAAGGKVNLSLYENYISTSTIVGKFLYSIASHNKNDFFKYGALLCKEAQILEEWVGGTTVPNVCRYVRSTGYDDFYNKIKIDSRFKGLGIPSKYEESKELWETGSTEPFYFTLNTLINRLWGQSDSAVNDITQIVTSFLKNAKFIHVNILNSDVVITETPFENVSKWGTEYHSRATAAWHNWMAIQTMD